MEQDQRATAIIPCSNIDAAEAFFARLGFTRGDGSIDGYRMLADGRGGHVHLVADHSDILQPETNPCGLYLYREDVDALAATLAGEIIEKDGASDKPWGMYEFAVNGPDGLLVRIGWPTRLRE